MQKNCTHCLGDKPDAEFVDASADIPVCKTCRSIIDDIIDDDVQKRSGLK